MKTKTKRVIPLFLFLMLIFLGFNITVTSSSSTILLSNFDNVASGLDSGTSGFLTWDKKSGSGEFRTSNSNFLSAPNSFEITSGGTLTNGWWNLTEDFNYINKINLSYYIGGLSTNGDFYIYFYNGSNNVIKLHVDADEKISWYTVGVGEHVICDMAPTNRIYIVITHLTTNQFNISIYNGTADNFIAGANYAGNYAGNYSTFTGIYFETDTVSQSHYFDNFYATVGSDPDYAGDFSDDNVICSGDLNAYAMTNGDAQYVEHRFFNSFTGTITGVLLPISDDQYNQVSSSISDYSMYVNGIPCGHPDEIIPYNGNNYALVWTGLTISLLSEKPLFSFYCSKYVAYSEDWYWYGVGIDTGGSGESRYHNSTTWYQNSNLDGTQIYGGRLALCFTYDLDIDGSDAEEIPVSLLDQYKTLYGSSTYNDTFIEFYGQNIECYHGIDDNPVIIYYVTDDYLDACDSYMFKIKNNYNVSVYSGFISLSSNNKSAKLTIHDFAFSYVGQYYLELYNMTGSCVYQNVFLVRSRPIYVCREGIGVGYQGTDDDATDVDTNDYTSTIAFVACLCIGLFAGFITMNGTAFAAGFLGSIMFMSIPDQPFTYFPLAVLAIAGFILVIMFMYMLIRR